MTTRTIQAMKRIAASRFKAQCLTLLDTLDAEGLVVTKHGRPVARVIRFGTESKALIGCLRDRIEIKGDLLSTGIPWDADVEP